MILLYLLNHIHVCFEFTYLIQCFVHDSDKRKKKSDFNYNRIILEHCCNFTVFVESYLCLFWIFPFTEPPGTGVWWEWSTEGTLIWCSFTEFCEHAFFCLLDHILFMFKLCGTIIKWHSYFTHFSMAKIHLPLTMSSKSPPIFCWSTVFASPPRVCNPKALFQIYLPWPPWFRNK